MGVILLDYSSITQFFQNSSQASTTRDYVTQIRTPARPPSTPFAARPSQTQGRRANPLVNSNQQVPTPLIYPGLGPEIR
jgi:hypothetical protein